MLYNLCHITTIMKFKPTRKKIIISISIPFLIITSFLILIKLSGGSNCSYGSFFPGSFRCSIFEFIYQILGPILVLWLILSLIIYIIYSLFQKKKS